MSPQPEAACDPAVDAAGEAAQLVRSVVLVGLMGAGKSKVGRALAKRLRVGFADADDAIIEAAGMSIPEIFAQFGEPRFRELERRVVLRLLDAPPQVVALGGGAFVDPAIRARALETAHTVWLRADLDTLVARVNRKKGTRPLLADGDPREKLASLMEQRHPVYANAHVTVDTSTQPADDIAARIAAVLVEEGLLH